MYAEPVLHLLSTYATDNVIAEIISNTHSFSEDPSIPATFNFDTQWINVVCCGQVYDETQLNVLFIEKL